MKWVKVISVSITNFPLRTTFTTSHRFWQIVVLFLFVSSYFLFPLWFPYWCLYCLVVCCLLSRFLCFFSSFHIVGFLFLYRSGKKRCLIWFQISFLKIFLSLFNYGCSHFPPLCSTALPTPHLPHSILPPVVFVHRSFIHVPWGHIRFLICKYCWTHLLRYQGSTGFCAKQFRWTFTVLRGDTF